MEEDEWSTVIGGGVSPNFLKYLDEDYESMIVRFTWIQRSSYQVGGEQLHFQWRYHSLGSFLEDSALLVSLQELRNERETPERVSAPISGT